MIGATEIIMICAVVLLIFGGKKLPEFMKGLGQGVSQFKKGLKEDETNYKDKQVSVEDEDSYRRREEIKAKIIKEKENNSDNDK